MSSERQKALVKEFVAKANEWPQMHFDEWENVVSGLGRAATDKRVSANPSAPRNAQDAARWDRIYHGDGLAARIAELLPFDETREGWQVRIESETVDEEQRTEDPTMGIEDRAEMETGVMDKLQELNTQEIFFQARLWARNFGGALVFLGVDDGTPLEEPLDTSKIKSFTHLNVFDRFEWVPEKWYTDPSEAKFGLPKTYRIGERNVPGGVVDIESADASGEIHETRFIRFDGPTTSRRRRVLNHGWHDPIWVRLYSMVRDFSQTWGGVAAMLQDFRVAVWKMKGLADALKAGDHDDVIERFRIMNLCISVSNAVPLDAENEDYEKKSTQLTGLADVLDRFAEQLSAQTGYPISLLFGRAPAGLNSTGDKDLIQYYDMVSASQEIHVKKPLEEIIELIFLTPDGPTKGKVPDSWSLKFNPLWQLDAKSEAERREIMSKADKNYIDKGVLTADEVAISRFGGDEYSIETKLNLEERAEREEVEEGIEGRMTQVEALLATQATPAPLPGVPEPTDKEDRIRKVGAKYQVTNKAGNKVLGSHSTRAEAEKQLAAVEASKTRRDNFRRRGPRDWTVHSNTGAVIGRHSTRAGAQSQIAHILDEQGVIVERLSASEWIVVNAENDIIGVHTTRRGAAAQVDEILERVDSDDAYIGTNDKPVAYYAHPMETYGTEIEEDDLADLKAKGYEVINPNDPALADVEGMEPFLELVRESDVVFARGETSGVNYEVHEANKHGITVVALGEEA